MAELVVHRLGRVEYGDGLELQKRFASARAAREIGDVVLLLEHSPVLTLGRGAKAMNIVAPKEQLDAMGVDVYETSRGGDVTYHGPGQIVGYPIFQLEAERQDVRRYVRDIEEIQIRTVAEYGLQAARIPRWPGVWLGEENALSARKIAAIGVHISRWLTTHGFALNVNTDLSHFGLIVPCGIREAGVTSIQKELGRTVPLAEVEQVLAKRFGEVFGAEIRFAGPPELRTVAVAVWTSSSDGPRVLLLKRRAERGGFWQIVTGRIEPGESPEVTARRELEEETGQGRPVKDLGYRHSFAWGDGPIPQIAEENGFGAFVDSEFVPKLSDEHEEHRWVPLPEALELLPFEGLRRTVKRAVTA